MSQSIFPLLAGSFAVVIAGCATPPETTTPNLDSKFGQAVNMAKAQQTLNPDASLNTDPVSGMTGKEGKLVIDAYHKSLEPPPPPATIINIGGGLSGSN